MSNYGKKGRRGPTGKTCYGARPWKLRVYEQHVKGGNPRNNIITTWLRLAGPLSPSALISAQARTPWAGTPRAGIHRPKFSQLLKISREGTPQPVPMLCHLHSKKVLPSIQSEHPVLQFVPIISCPGNEYHWKELGSVLCASSLQVFVRIDKIPPEPFLLQAE